MQAKEIQLTGKLAQGASTLVDAEDSVWLNKKKWYMTSIGYPARTVYQDGKAKKLLMHRAIMEAAKNQEIDHINRDKLDNTRSNLRFCSHRENMLNRDFTFVRKGGVYLDKQSGKWHARLQVNLKRRSLGHFKTRELALRALEGAG